MNQKLKATKWTISGYFVFHSGKSWLRKPQNMTYNVYFKHIVSMLGFFWTDIYIWHTSVGTRKNMFDIT